MPKEIHQMENLLLRDIRPTDPKEISQLFRKIGWSKPLELYETYLKLQKTGERDIIIAQVVDQFAGYLTIKWISGYRHFSEEGIPEINDLNVLPSYRRKGVASALLDEAEKRISSVSDFAGIGFGVTADYGPAQILYTRRGYIPNGKGLARNERTTDYGDVVTVGDELAFYLVRRLTPG